MMVSQISCADCKKGDIIFLFFSYEDFFFKSLLKTKVIFHVMQFSARLDETLAKNHLVAQCLLGIVWTLKVQEFVASFRFPVDWQFLRFLICVH